MDMKKRILILGIYVIILQGCAEFLEKKSDMALALPSRVADLQALLDNEFNTVASYPVAGDIGADYYYVKDQTLKPLGTDIRAGYLYAGDESFEFDWRASYEKIFTANLVLEEIDQANLAGSPEQERNRVKGAAYFQRGWSFLGLAILYAPAYIEMNSSKDLGLPLRTTANINISFQRSSLRETFMQITGDLSNAAALLPYTVEKPTRPSKATAFAALARAYLYMGDNDKALSYADSCLQIKRNLLNYKNIAQNLAVSFPLFNEEVLLHNTVRANGAILGDSRALVDTMLWKSYSNNDYRKHVFFKLKSKGEYVFKGNYSGENSSLLFCGIATDEIYLIKAEAAARLNKLEEARNTLKDLLHHRYVEHTEPNLKINQDALINLVIAERKKELAFRAGIRWADIKRLNAQYGAEILLVRQFEGKEYKMEPNDKRFTLLIPQSVILEGELIQNSR